MGVDTDCPFAFRLEELDYYQGLVEYFIRCRDAEKYLVEATTGLHSGCIKAGQA